MKKLVLTLAALAAFQNSIFAQEPGLGSDRDEAFISLGQVQATPEMWFYQEEVRRQQDPRFAVRQKAQYRAQQRQRRIASMQWFGMSNSRPVANPTPFQGPYSPAWISNTYSPYQWSGSSRGTTILNVRRTNSGAMYGLW